MERSVENKGCLETKILHWQMFALVSVRTYYWKI